MDINGVTINRSEALFNIPDWSFYIPIIIGIGLFVLALIIGISIKKKLMILIGAILLLVSLIFSITLSIKNTELIGYEDNITIKDDANMTEIRTFYSSLTKNDDGTYTAIYYYDKKGNKNEKQN